MSTNDVPGAKSNNNDELATGCWAEHEDGSLIFVEGTEGGRAVFTVFDMEQEPPIEYRDAMAEKAFKKQFSWKKGKKDKWTWHDKTPFPWDRIIDAGGRSGPGFTHADDLLNAAQRVAQSRKMKGTEVDPDDYSHMERKVTDRVVKTIQEALGRLGI